MRLTWRKAESEGSDDSTALVIELSADEPLVEGAAVEEAAGEEFQEQPRRVARLLAGSRRLAGRLNPVVPAKRAVDKSGRAARSVVVKLRPRRLAGAIREFRRIGSADLGRLASGVGRGAKGVGGRLGRVSARKMRSVRVVTTALRGLVGNIDPGVATSLARETTRLARTTIAKLDPRQVEDAVRRVAETIDSDGKQEQVKPSGGGGLDGIARTAVAKVGPERAVKRAADATRALKRLVARLDPDQIGETIGELVAVARSANDNKGRLRVVGFLASLVGEAGRVLKSVAQEVEFRDVLVVVLIVLSTNPGLLVAAGVSAAAVPVLVAVFSILLETLPERGSPGVRLSPQRRLPQP